jgi:hypothetical protein
MLASGHAARQRVISGAERAGFVEKQRSRVASEREVLARKYLSATLVRQDRVDSCYAAA